MAYTVHRAFSSVLGAIMAGLTWLWQALAVWLGSGRIGSEGPGSSAAAARRARRRERQRAAAAAGATPSAASGGGAVAPSASSAAPKQPATPSGSDSEDDGAEPAGHTSPLLAGAFAGLSGGRAAEEAGWESVRRRPSKTAGGHGAHGHGRGGHGGRGAKPAAPAGGERHHKTAAHVCERPGCGAPAKRKCGRCQQVRYATASMQSALECQSNANGWAAAAAHDANKQGA